MDEETRALLEEIGTQLRKLNTNLKEMDKSIIAVADAIDRTGQ